MTPIRRILVPTDFSDTATAALRAAVAIARRANATIVLLYADRFDPPAEFTASQVGAMAEEIEQERARAVAELTRYAEEVIPFDLAREIVVVRDLPVPAIVCRADADADLVVMGTHGRTGIGRLLLGSVAERVIHSIRKPVLTIRPATRPTIDWSIRRILVAVNSTEAARAALEQAVEIATLFDAGLTVLHVVEPKTDHEIRTIYGWIADLDERTLARVSTLVEHGHAAQEVIAMARISEVDLIVVGAEPRVLRDVTTLGPTSTSLTASASCPVLTVMRQRKDVEVCAGVTPSPITSPLRRR
ncbi:MAG TPA: universal stress protein [Thermoanaerobaculia bacterium]